MIEGEVLEIKACWKYTLKQSIITGQRHFRQWNPAVLKVTEICPVDSYKWGLIIQLQTPYPKCTPAVNCFKYWRADLIKNDGAALTFSQIELAIY